MHACGHDGHVAVGLTAANLLKELQPSLDGTIKLVFQPAEEGLGGAEAMIQDGVLHDPIPQAALGLHLWNDQPVGWAAATGSLSIPAFLLFAVIFLWTPPHFWALALIKRRDYARAGVPMLPNVRGARTTRNQILIYTLELVALTLLLPVLGLGGVVFLVLAAVLGAALLYSAWKVWKVGGNKIAWGMYRYSSLYLALLFAALVVDALV